MSSKNFRLKFTGLDREKPGLKEYDIFIDDFLAGAVAFLVTDGVMHIYNAYLDEEWRGGGLFREWLLSFNLEIDAHDVLHDKEGSWSSLCVNYSMHKNSKPLDFEDMVFTAEELTGELV